MNGEGFIQNILSIPIISDMGGHLCSNIRAFETDI